MISSFSSFLIEEEQTVFFSFGRMNPPTIGHGKLLDKLASLAGRGTYKVYLSKTSDNAANPLKYDDKIKHVRRMFPKHARAIVYNKDIATVFDAVMDLFNSGFRHIVLVAGADRVSEFTILLNKYNGKKSRHGTYNFQSIKVVSAGERDPDAEGVEGASATKQRKFATDNDFTSFAQGVPPEVSTKDARVLFNDVRAGLGLKEADQYKAHVQLEKVNDVREKYVTGALFNIGDSVVIKATEQVATVAVLGSNYVIVESNGTRYRKWLTDVELLETKKTDEWYPSQPEWGTDASSARAKQITPGEGKSFAKGLARYRKMITRNR